MASIHGLQKTTLIDYPGKIACTIFFSSCNFRCPFCHNKDLVLENDSLPRFSEKEILQFLKARAGLLEGVVLTGGEPLLYQNLKEFIKKIKKMPFLVKLDTNGTNPKLLKKLINDTLIDHVAMDFKGSTEKYEKIVGAKVNKKAILESMKFLISGKIPYELRTTVVPGIHSDKDLVGMAKELNQITEQLNNKTTVKWFLQQFRPKNCLDPNFNKLKPYPKKFFDKILPKLQKIIPNTFLRGI